MYFMRFNNIAINENPDTQSLPQSKGTGARKFLGAIRHLSIFSLRYFSGNLGSKINPVGARV